MCYPAMPLIAATTASLAQLEAQRRAYAAIRDAAYMPYFGSVESKLTPRGNCPSCGSGKYTRKAQGYVCDHCGNNR